MNATKTLTPATPEQVEMINSIWNFLTLLGKPDGPKDVEKLTTFRGQVRSAAELRAVNLRLKEQFRKPAKAEDDELPPNFADLLPPDEKNDLP